MPVLHNFVNPIADEPGFLGTKPSDWNDTHSVSIVDADVDASAAIAASKLAAAGLNTQIQFNDGGTFGGDANFTWNKLTKFLTLKSDVNSSYFNFLKLETNDPTRGGNLSIIGGNGVGGNGGGIYAQGGNALTGGQGGNIDFTAGNGVIGGDVFFRGGFSTLSDNEGGIIQFIGGTGAGTGQGGSITFSAGNGNGAGSGLGGDIVFQPGLSSSGLVSGKIILSNLVSTKSAILDVGNIATSDKTFTFPNASGTIALTSDIPSLPLSPANGGTGINNGSNTLTVPATMTGAGLEVANVFTTTQTIQTTNGDTVLDTKFSKDWATLASATPDQDDGGWGGYTLRQVINSAQITASSGSQKVRVSLETGAAVIGAVYIGLAATSGDAYDFDTTPVQITFDSGSSGYTTAGGTKVSDAVSFVYTAGRNLVVAIYASGVTTYRSKDTQTGWQAYYKGGSDASTVNAGGYASYKALVGVVKVEAGTPDLTSILKVTAGSVQLPSSTASYVLATNASKDVVPYTPTSNLGLLGGTQSWTGINTFNGVNLRRANMFTDNGYAAVVLGDMASGETTGAGMFVARANPANVPFPAFMGFDGGGGRQLYFGGGTWSTPDATYITFWTAPTYDETQNAGRLRLAILGAQATEFTNSTTTNNAVLGSINLLSRVSTASTGGANGFGTGLSFTAETATDGTDQQQGLISTAWVDATNATRKAKMSLSAYDTAARLGIEIEASGSAVKLGFFGVTPVVQQANNTAIDTLLSNLGLRASGGESFFDTRLMLPMGEISYFNMTGTIISIAAQSDGSTNMVKAAPTTTLNNDKDFDNGGANNGRLRYTGATTRTFHVACTISIAPAGANDTFVFGIAKNGTVVAASKVLVQVTTASNIRSTAMHLMVSLATNDYLEMFVGNTTDADDCTVHALNLFAMGM